MKMPSSYWEKRTASKLKSNLKDADKTISKMNRYLDKSAREVEDEILKLFNRYAKNNELSYNHAFQMLTSKEYSMWRTDLADYVKEINTSGGNPELLLELNTLSAKSQISRLEEHFYQIQKILDRDYKFKYKEVEELLTNSVKKNFTQTAFDLDKSLGFHANFSFVDKKKVDEVLSLPWSGTHYSKRIWNNRTKLKNMIEEQITQSIIQGKDLRKITSEIAETFETSKNVAKRLVNTEHAYACAQGDLLMYEEFGVSEYEYIATLDTKTSSMCRELDGEVFRLDEAVPGVNFPPLHPNCRSTTIMADADTLNESTRIARDKDGKNIYLKSGVSYNDYKEALENDDWSKVKAKTSSSMSNMDLIKPKPIAGVERGEPMPREKANSGNPNPHYGEDIGYSINCQTCVVSYEARLRGYDVEALPNTRGSMLEKLSRQTNLAWIDRDTGNLAEYIYDSETTTPKKFYEFMNNVVKENERYTIQFIWRGRGLSGHIISLDRDVNGELRFYDPQIGKTYGEKQIKKYIRDFKYVTKVHGHVIPVVPKIMRIDDKEFNYGVVNKILRKFVGKG